MDEKVRKDRKNDRKKAKEKRAPTLTNRIRQCNAKIQHYTRIANEADKGSLARNNAIKNAAIWRKKRDEALAEKQKAKMNKEEHT